MLVAAHQPNYLPYCGFFHKIAHCDVFVIIDTVQFVKNGAFAWQHRNRVRSNNGWMWLTVPVLTKGKSAQKINEVEIMNDINWRHKHWQSIYQNYKKAPYFYKYSDFFEHIYKTKWDKLLDLNMEIIFYLLKVLKIDKKVTACSELGANGHKTQLLVDLCNKAGADMYLSGIHGRDYIDYGVIKKTKLKVIFQNFIHPIYDQGYSDFISNLSIIDLLFHKGEKSIDLITNNSQGVRSYVE